MSDYYLSDLGAETEFADDDLFHFRNTAGIDKKITGANMTTDILEYVSHVRRTEFLVTTAGWYTLFRTQKNFGGLIKVSAYGSNVRSFFTMSVYGDEDADEHKVTCLESSDRGSVPGIEQIRWGDAGAGNGMCLQVYVDPDTDTDCRIKAYSWGAAPSDLNPGHGFVFETTAVSTATDFDGNAVSTWDRTYYRAAFAELMGANRYRGRDYPDIVVDGSTVTRVEAGVYNSIQFTGNGSMGIGRYVVLEDFTIDSGATATVDNMLDMGISAGYKEHQYDAWMGASCGAAWSGYTRAGNNGGGRGAGSSNLAYQGPGGSAPCGAGRNQSNADSGSGGGYVLLNVLGKVDIQGTITAAGGAGAASGGSYGSGGGGGGYIGIRALEAGGDFSGTFNANGGAGGNDTYDGGGGGGGVIEVYHFESSTPSGTFNVAVGSRGSGGTAGSAFLISLVDQPERTPAGGSAVVTNDEYLYAGKIIDGLGGFWK